MSSKLQKAEGALRVLQLLLVVIFLIFWIYLRLNGFGTKWRGAPAGAETYGTILFALGVVAALAGIIVAAASMAYVVRTHYANHGTKFHVGRWLVEFVTLWLFIGERIMLNVIPAKFLPELIQTSVPAAQPTYGQIYTIANAGISVNIFLFACSHILVIVQAVYSRRERKRNHNFGKLDGEAYGSSSYLTTQAQSFDAPAQPLAPVSQPTYGYVQGFGEQQQPSTGFDGQTPAGAYPISQHWDDAPAPQQGSYHQQQPSWGGSTHSTHSLAPLNYGGGYQPGYAAPGMIGGGLTPNYGAQPQQPQQTYQQSVQNSYRQSNYGRPAPSQGGYHSRGSSFGTVYGNAGAGMGARASMGPARPSISTPMFQGQNRF